ncbi:MAG: serine/threonine protein kinase [Bryobacterales bacterium]|nr:serine/threonine protein kinase [Bryobacterales bacterium]
MGLSSGEVIGDYRIIGPLGAGGMGTVYKVRHLISDRLEALKVLLPEVSDFAGIDERFLREIKVQASLQHPNIALLHNAFRSGEQVVMVMELVEGSSLRDMVRTGPLSLATGVSIMSQVLSALDYAHARGIIHRDIKPSNIVVTPDGRAKLLDFGLAIIPRDRRITQSGAVVGSLPYMSPEQVRGEEVDSRSDLYSLGATFYEIATGKCPIEGSSPASVLLGHLERRPAPPLNVPAPLSGFILKALEKNPADRFQTAGEFLAQITAAVTLAQTVTLPSQPAAWQSDRLERVTRELANYIGPIAKILVTRASRGTADYGELCRRVAGEIQNPADRDRFLSAVR